MGILLFILFGFVVGLIARALMPGNQKMGLAMTTILGMIGSFVGGVLVALVTSRRVTDFDTAGLIGSILGAILVLAIATAVMSRRRVLV